MEPKTTGVTLTGAYKVVNPSGVINNTLELHNNSNTDMFVSMGNPIPTDADSFRLQPDAVWFARESLSSLIHVKGTGKLIVVKRGD